MRQVLLERREQRVPPDRLDRLGLQGLLGLRVRRVPLVLELLDRLGLQGLQGLRVQLVPLGQQDLREQLLPQF